MPLHRQFCALSVELVQLQLEHAHRRSIALLFRKMIETRRIKSDLLQPTEPRILAQLD